MRAILSAAVVGLTVVGIVAAVPAIADRRGEGRGPEAMFERFDTNGDDLVTRAEIEAARSARFAEMDADGNGSVTRDEFVNHAQARAGDRAGEAFDRLDSDGDGVLSADVFAARAERMDRRLDRMIDRLDADGDDAISREEMEAGMERFAGRGKGHKGRFGDRRN